MVLARAVEVTSIAAAIERTATVELFTYQPPTLSELFRQAVAA